jgi:shikimate dehydrogenase
MAEDGVRRLLTGLIGAPIKHSASPAMHEAAAEALGMRCHYQLVEVAGADAAGLRLMLEGVRRLGFAGVNVTFPYKEAVVPLLDALSPDAAAIGAVNTVVARDGHLTGHNTDMTGFARAAAEAVAASDRGPVALVGAGGVAKASHLVDALAAMQPDRPPARAAASVEAALDGAVGLVNGTPVGMWPSQASPVPGALLHAGLWVADAVYSPLWTPLLKAAKAAGARVVTGRDLAIFQAVDAFALFAGVTPSAEIMAVAFDAVMHRRGDARNPS